MPEVINVCNDVTQALNNESMKNCCKPQVNISTTVAQCYNVICTHQTNRNLEITCLCWICTCKLCKFNQIKATMYNVIPVGITSNSYCRRFWHATLRLRSAIRRHHPPQRAALSQICCFGERKVVLFQILLDGAEPRDAGTT